MVRELLVCLAAGGLFGPVLPDAPVAAAAPVDKSPDLDRQVRQLVDDLGAATRAQRMAAEKRLLELGPQVLPLLPVSELLPTISVREAVRRIRVELERAAARASVLPSRVTLAGKQSLADALAEMTRQTQNRLDGHLLPEATRKAPVDLKVDALPFWEVLDRVAAQTNVRYEYDAGTRGLKILPAKTDRRPVEMASSYAGAFRVTALPAERIRRDTGQSLPPKDDLGRLTVLLLPEPRLRPLFLQFAMSDVTCRAGPVSLPAFSPEASYELALGEGGGPTRIQLDFILPKGDAGKALDMKGKLRCTTAAGHELVRFTGLDKATQAGGGNVSRRRGGVTVTLNRVRVAASSPGKQNADIQVTVAYDSGGPAFESHQRWILHNEVFLEGREGKRVNLNGGSETSLLGEQGTSIEYHFVDLAGNLADYSFVYVAPTLIVDVPVEFEIQSVPVGKK
jgi:hypothetical protein